MQDISKIKVMDVMSTCRMRHEMVDPRCKDCIYCGRDCIDAHIVAESAVRILRKGELENELKNVGVEL